MTDRITLGIDRQIASNTSVGVEGTYAKAYNLERLNDPNLTVCTSNTQVGCTGNANILANGTSKMNGQPVYSTVRPDPFYGRISTYTTDATSKYEAVTFNVQHRFTKDLQFFASATWSEDKDSDSNERNYAGAQAEDLHNLNGSYGWSNRDQRWKIGANANWNTPWWGIGLSGTYRFTTGSPYTATTGADENRDGFFNDRPTIDGAGTFSRNQFRQPDFQQLDFRLAKTFFGPFGSSLGQVGLTAIAECFNCTNAGNRFVTKYSPSDRPRPPLPRSASPTASRRCRARFSSPAASTSRQETDTGNRAGATPPGFFCAGICRSVRGTILKGPVSTARRRR